MTDIKEGDKVLVFGWVLILDNEENNNYMWCNSTKFIVEEINKHGNVVIKINKNLRFCGHIKQCVKADK